MLMMSDVKQNNWRQKQGSDYERAKVGCSEEMKYRGAADRCRA